MKHQKHTHWSATAAIAAALALTAAPLAAQSTDAPVTPAPTLQAEPVAPPPPATVSPAPTIDVPDVSAAPDTSVAAAPEPSATTTTTTTRTTKAPAPSMKSTTHSTTSHTTTVTHAAPVVAAAPVAAAPATPPSDLASPPVETQTTTTVTQPAAEPAPTPVQTSNVIGTMGVVLLALLALAILAAGLLFFRRRPPAIVESEYEAAPVVTDTVDEPIAPVPASEPVAVAATPMFPRRDANPVRGALPSDGAAVDLPARAPEDYAERNALFERMVDARPDKANPFTDKRQRMKRARLILQSLGRKFDREPMIDLSQYPNNWPELARQYHKAA